MILRKTTMILITFLNINFASAQKNISGTILDKETHEPIAYAHLIIPSEKRGATTNKNGAFEFTVSNESLDDENYLKEVPILFFKEGRHNAKFRLQIVSSTVDKMPVKGIEMPKEGFFAVVKHLFIEEIIHLRVNDSLKIKDIKQKRYAPIFKGIIEENGESFSYYMGVDGWKKVRKLKMPPANFKESEVVAPAFKLKLAN